MSMGKPIVSGKPVILCEQQGSEANVSLCSSSTTFVCC